MFFSLGCKWESLGELRKILMSGSWIRPTKPESLGLCPRYQYFFQSYPIDSMCSLIWKPMCWSLQSTFDFFCKCRIDIICKEYLRPKMISLCLDALIRTLKHSQPNNFCPICLRISAMWWNFWYLQLILLSQLIYIAIMVKGKIIFLCVLEINANSLNKIKFL